MSHRADGGAEICHKRGPISPGVKSSAVWLWGNSTAVSPPGEALLWTYLCLFPLHSAVTQARFCKA